MIVSEYPTRDILADSLAALVAEQLAATLAKKGKATLAVPGGTTPAQFLQRLSAAKIDWGHVSVVLTDERQVAETSPRSNTRLLRETLFQGNAAKARLVPFNPRQVSANLPLDVCVLGMGADMHTASLFPGVDGVDEALDIKCPQAVMGLSSSDGEERITLTAPALRSAANLHILITGRDKMTALDRARKPGPATSAPIRIALTAPGNVTVHYAD